MRGATSRLRSVQPDEVVADRFAIERLVAERGMGAVYRARDLHGDALAAVKIVRQASPKTAERFAREARILADAAAARAAIAFARERLLAIADRLGDARAREGFLHGIPNHRRILALAEELGSVGESRA